MCQDAKSQRNEEKYEGWSLVVSAVAAVVAIAALWYSYAVQEEMKKTRYRSDLLAIATDIAHKTHTTENAQGEFRELRELQGDLNSEFVRMYALAAAKPDIMRQTVLLYLQAANAENQERSADEAIRGAKDVLGDAVIETYCSTSGCHSVRRQFEDYLRIEADDKPGDWQARRKSARWSTMRCLVDTIYRETE